MGNKLDIAKSLEVKDGFECHGLKYPPSYSVGSDNNTRKRAKKKGTGESRRAQQRMSPAGPDDWLHCDYSVDNIVLSGGGSKGYAFVGALKVRNKFKALEIIIIGNVLSTPVQVIFEDHLTEMFNGS